MPERHMRQREERTEFTGKRIHVNATVLVGRPAVIVPLPRVESEGFVRKDLEGTLDKVSRSSVKGKYRDVLPSSEEFIRAKGREAEMEDR